jgi:hypothetical protein
MYHDDGQDQHNLHPLLALYTVNYLRRCTLMLSSVHPKLEM